MADYDRTREDVGNVVMLEHVNTRVPDQTLATAFYVMGLGLTRDPYLMTGTTNMWINAGRSQFHLPTGAAQVVRGHTGIVLPGRDALLRRLKAVQDLLAGTAYGFREEDGFVAVTCPWGNHLRCFEPSTAFPDMQIGMPYVAFNVPEGSAASIATFYQSILAAPAVVEEFDGSIAARVSAGTDQALIYRETDETLPAFDGHHIAIYLADFSGPYSRLSDAGLISEESNQHQYRFVDIIDPETRQPVFRLEHEVRSMRLPLYARPLVNRNPAVSNQTYAPGHQDLVWATGASLQFSS